MKTKSNPFSKTHIAALSAIVLSAATGCVSTGNPLGSIGDLLGVQVNGQRGGARNAYVYYPKYDVYYDRNADEFVSVENGKWVSRNAPRNTSAKKVFSSQSVDIRGYDSPAYHRSAMMNQNARSRYQSNDWDRQESRNRYNQNQSYRRY